LVAFTAVGILGCEKAQQTGGTAAVDNKTATPASPKSGSGEDESRASDSSAVKAKMRLKLYFSDEQGMKLVEEIRDVTQTTEPAAATVRALIDGPKESGQPTIPLGTKLNKIRIKNQIAAVDLSREFVANCPGGSTGERLAVYSIVNSLTEFNTIKQVKFLVDGKDVETIAGHLDTSEPLSRDESLL
jgi:germination protein M